MKAGITRCVNGLKEQPPQRLRVSAGKHKLPGQDGASAAGNEKSDVST
jgi:hypothetical protein